MDQFNQKADRATHGALSLPALKDGDPRGKADDECWTDLTSPFKVS